MPPPSATLFEDTIGDESLANITKIDSQKAAVNALKQPQNWAQNAFGVVAPEKSGLTHILRAWCKDFDAIYLTASDLEALPTGDIPALLARPIVIDDLDLSRNNATAILSVFNLCKQASQLLLLGSHTSFAALGFSSKDLVSRLNTLQIVEIGPLTEDTTAKWVELLAKNRHMKVSDTAMQYLLKHIDLTHAHMALLVDALDTHYASQNRAISRHSVRQIALDKGWLLPDTQID